MRKTAAERIASMETILDTANEKLDDLESAITALREYQNEIQKLEAYYTGADWKKDFALDEAGKLPADLKRGVLSKDGVYSLLERFREIRERMGALGTETGDAGPEPAGCRNDT